ncbi:2-hydroxyacyl-CoA dehydratase [Lutibacter sp. B2]|nr:2-hydroxyacyl-CoA dehydratase [Lutibacter sp. B2]
MKIMKKVREKLKSRSLELQRLRSTGKKVVACFAGDFAPLEIIHAAGAEPITLISGGTTDALDASAHAMHRYMCPFSRAQYGYYELQHAIPYYKMFDMLVAPTTCTQLIQTASLFEYHSDIPVFKLGVPAPTDGERSKTYFKTVLGMMQERVESLTGEKVDDDKLKASIALYRRIRDLLKQISELRKQPTPPLKASEFILLNHASLLLAPEDVVELLNEALSEFSQRDVGQNETPRILMVGPCIAMGDGKVLDIIEESGAAVVVEDFAEGIMYYWENVDDSVDPMDALVEKYLMKRPNCAFTRGTTGRHLEFVSKLIKEFKVDGVVWYQLRLCDSYNVHSYTLSEYLRNADPAIPVIKVESEYDIADNNQLKTRIDTFIETIITNFKGGF